MLFDPTVPPERFDVRGMPHARPSGEARELDIEPKEGLEQVREILVGASQRDLERRLARVESHFAARGNDLQQETRRRMEVIETHLKKETDALALRVETEIVDTRDALRAFSREHREATSALEQRVVKLEEVVAKQQQALRQQVLESGEVVSRRAAS